MKNHFHFLVRIKEEEDIKILSPKPEYSDRSGRPCQVLPEEDPSGSKRLDGVLDSGRKPIPENQFGHLFNAYAKAFNKKYKRTGSLFERSFKRIEVEHEDYFKILVYYIHFNPIQHGFVDDLGSCPWSSYQDIVLHKKTFIQTNELIEWFGNRDTFLEYHRQSKETNILKELQIDNTSD